MLTNKQKVRQLYIEHWWALFADNMASRTLFLSSRPYPQLPSLVPNDGLPGLMPSAAPPVLNKIASHAGGSGGRKYSCILACCRSTTQFHMTNCDVTNFSLRGRPVRPVLRGRPRTIVGGNAISPAAEGLLGCHEMQRASCGERHEQECRWPHTWSGCLGLVSSGNEPWE